MKFFLTASAIAASFWATAACSQPEPASQAEGAGGGKEGAVALIYHRFGEDRIPLTNIREEQFRMHLNMIGESGRSVISAEDAAAALRADGAPDNSLVITVDDAYASFAEVAWPMLRARGWPVTLFVATDPVDQGLAGYLSWDEIRRLRDEGVSIGHHGAGHIHMIAAGADAARADIARASARFEEELGEVPTLFAYPYGEYSLEIADMVREMGFQAAFAQHSGAIGGTSAPWHLQRFAINENYGTGQRMQTILAARPMPVTGHEPADPPRPGPAPFDITLEFSEAFNAAARMSCFPSHQDGPADIEVAGDRRSAGIHLGAPLPPGRSRINCTAPDGAGGWYWYGLFYWRPGGAD